MYIHQYLLDQLLEIKLSKKVLVIFGPRQVGKTTLLNKLLEHKEKYLLISGEDIEIQQILSSQSIERLKAFVGSQELLVIDEAQRIANIGLNLKLLVDHCSKLQIIVTGSSAFDLGKNLGEPLTGRKVTFELFPLSQMELGSSENLAQTKARLEGRLIFGSYPEVILAADNKTKIEYLHELTSSYLYKDILEIEGIRKAKKIIQLLQLLALQIGREVSLSELGRQLGLDKNTVERYLDLLEKSFVLINIRGYSRNARKEISKTSRYYFYDLGVRNAIINQFNLLSMRNDVGEIWENYLITERLKKQAYKKIHTNNYFWRTYSQQEIDWVEERAGQLYGYEIKWQSGSRIKIPSEWNRAYPKAEFTIINQDNYLPFIL